MGLVVFLVVILWRKRQHRHSKPTIEHHGRSPAALSKDLSYGGRHRITRNPMYDGHVDRLDQGHQGPQQRQHHRSGHRYTSDKENYWSQGRHVYPSQAHYPAQQHHPHNWELATAVYQPYNQGYSHQGYQFYSGQTSRPGRGEKRDYSPGQHWTSAPDHSMSAGYTVYSHHSAPLY